MIGLLAGLSLCLAVVVAARDSGVAIDPGDPMSATLGLGFLLLAAFVGGRAAKRSRLPRITGYLAVGIAFGPFAWDLVPADMLQHFKVVDGVAVSLIALTAGAEMRLSFLRARAGQIVVVGLTSALLVLALTTGLQLALPGMFTYLPAEGGLSAVLVALLIGAICASLSPMVSIAAINDSNAKGPLSSMIMGTTILLDLVVIVLFAVLVAFTAAQIGVGESGGVGFTLAKKLGGSTAVGLGIGAAMSWYLRRVGREPAIFVIAVVLFVALLSEAAGLEALLVALAAGFYVENVSPVDGHDLIQAIERVSLPVYALFFAHAGTKVDLGALVDFWYVALLLVAARGLGNWAGSGLGARAARLEPEVRRYLWLGFVSQAGVSLALIAIIGDTFPWGGQVMAILIAMVAIHEIVGPVAVTWALERSGEAGRAGPDTGHSGVKPEEATRAPGQAPAQVTSGG